MKLPHDVSRCVGTIAGHPCPQRETCGRYLAREDCGYRTPFLIIEDIRLIGDCTEYLQARDATGGTAEVD